MKIFLVYIGFLICGCQPVKHHYVNPYENEYYIPSWLEIEIPENFHLDHVSRYPFDFIRAHGKDGICIYFIKNKTPFLLNQFDGYDNENFAEIWTFDNDTHILKAIQVADRKFKLNIPPDTLKN